MKTKISYREFDTNGNYILKCVDIDDLNLSELIELKNELVSYGDEAVRVVDAKIFEYASYDNLSIRNKEQERNKKAKRRQKTFKNGIRKRQKKIKIITLKGVVIFLNNFSNLC